MVIVRTYWNLTEAALAKSLLDDYEVFCALFDVNAHLYGRGPWAMPVRLMVHENQAELAIHLLAGDLEEAAKIQPDDAADLRAEGVAFEFEIGNPWELLTIAFYFMLPGLCFLQAKYPTALRRGFPARREIAAVAVSHFLGVVAIISAASLVAIYFYATRAADKSKSVADSNLPHR